MSKPTKLSRAGKQSLDNFIAEASKRDVPGFVFGAANTEGEIYFGEAGHKVIHDPSSEKVTPDSVFWLCSQTKLVVHFAALQLVAKGKLSPEDLVSKFFPEFLNTVILKDVTSDSSPYTVNTVPLTVKHLMNFSSGLFYPGVSPYTLPFAYTSTHDPNDVHGEFFRILKGGYPGIPLKFEPGTDFVYGWSSDVLGFVVEKVSGQTLEAYLKENIFEPLGITTTSFYLTEELERALLPLTFRRRETDGVLEPWNNHSELIQRDPKNVRRHLGGIGLYSSQRDYLKFIRYILQIRTGTLVVDDALKSVVDTLFTPALNGVGGKSLDAFTVRYTGLSWSTGCAVSTTDWPGMRRKGTAFWSGWAGTYYWIDPTTGVVAIFATQILPTRDPEVLKLFVDSEKAFYHALELKD